MNQKNNKIPNRFKLFADTINVVWDDKYLNDKRQYGESDYSECKITLATEENRTKLSQDRIIDTFYHERTHAILDAMHERDLSGNEQFVDVFSKLLRQADETAEFDL